MKRTTFFISSVSVTVLLVVFIVNHIGTVKGRSDSAVASTIARTQPVAPTTQSGIAAMVNNQSIPLAKVSAIAVRIQGSTILDQIIGEILIDQEAKRRNIIVTAEEVDARINKIQAMILPKSLNDSLRERKMRLEDFRSRLGNEIKLQKLLANKIQPVRMVHARDLFVNISPFAGMAPKLYTAAQAEKIMAAAQQKLKEGAAFEDVARQYGDENIDKKSGGDLGIVTNFPASDADLIARGFSGQPGFLKTCFSLKKGETLHTPLRTQYGLHLIQVISTGDNPLQSDAAMYEEARNRAVDYQYTELAPQYVKTLQNKGRVIIYLNSGKPGPDGVAATVNGEQIPLSRVSEIAVNSVGLNVVEKLIDNAMVDDEAKRRNVTISRAQVESSIVELQHKTKSHSIEEILHNGHMTIDELRDMQRVKLEAETMVRQSIAQVNAAHIREICIILKQDTNTRAGHREEEAKQILARALSELRAGKKFEDIARKYSDDVLGKERGGDLGIVTEKDAYEPDFLKTAMALKKGEITSDPIQTSLKLSLLQAVSTSADHPVSENQAYNTAQQNAKERAVQAALPNFIRSLRNTNHVVNYLN